ncbi:hypothetical protein FJY71_08460 [candidate division WOR-3 bacterium]|nr:hypothetical protein [candidate division WOR-3 bacterium]
MIDDHRFGAARSRSAVQQELARLEAECRQRGVKLVYDDLRGEGGLCRVRKSFYIIINRRASTETRIRMIGTCLGKLPAEQPTAAAATTPQPAPVETPVASA